ncbi:MAG: A24 family peptidase [Nanoarchaeota archaeon]
MIAPFVFISFAFCFLGLFIGTITDLKTREVPDMLNFGLLFLGFCLSLLASFVYWDFSYIVSSLLGFLFCFLFACLMFYTGQWGGGDAKMLMAMGALIGLPLSSLGSLASVFSSLWSLILPSVVSLSSLPFLLLFLFFVFFVGGIYGSVWLFVLLLKHRREFSLRCVVFFTDPKHRVLVVFLHLVSLLLLISSFFLDAILFRLLAFFFGIMIPVLFYGFVAIKILEQIAFVKEIPIAKVTEGDWVANDIIVAGKVIVGKKDLGISREQLDELKLLFAKKKIKTVAVKYGIPFVPSFFIAFIVTVVLVYVV